MISSTVPPNSQKVSIGDMMEYMGASIVSTTMERRRLPTTIERRVNTTMENSTTNTICFTKKEMCQVWLVGNQHKFTEEFSFEIVNTFTFICVKYAIDFK